MKVNIGKPPSTKSKKPQKINVKIDKWDTWNADWTIANIAHPMLIQLKETKHGAPYVDDDDVPDHLRSTAAEPKETEDHIDSNHFARWDYVLDEMIWAMYEIANHLPGEDVFFDHSEVNENSCITDQVRQIKIDRDKLNAYYARLNKATCLFGKYFMNLWD